MQFRLPAHLPLRLNDVCDEKHQKNEEHYCSNDYIVSKPFDHASNNVMIHFARIFLFSIEIENCQIRGNPEGFPNNLVPPMPPSAILISFPVVHFLYSEMIENL